MAMSEGFGIQSLDIDLDSSVKSITRTAAMCLSGSIANGIVIAQNPNPRVRIFNNRIEFGKCNNPDLIGISGNVYPCFYVEYGNLVYRYNTTWKCSFFGKQLDYKGMFAPSVPDDYTIFNLIYPRFQ